MPGGGSSSMRAETTLQEDLLLWLLLLLFSEARSPKESAPLRWPVYAANYT